MRTLPPPPPKFVPLDRTGLTPGQCLLLDVAEAKLKALLEECERAYAEILRRAES